MEAFVAQRQAAQPGIRIVPNRHGIPKLLLRDGQALTAGSARDPDQIARDFLLANGALFLFDQSELNQLRLEVRDVGPTSTHLVYTQTLNGIAVFEGQIKFTLGKNGEVVQVGTGEAAPGLSTSTVPTLRPDEAELAARSAAQAPATAQFLRAAELVIFPLDASESRLAYRMFLEVDAARLYEILIDAQDGKLLFRHNAYVNAGQARVWTQSPSQGGSRTLVTFPDGWLPVAGTVTTGNNVDAFIDANGDDQPDALNSAEFQNGRAASASQNFDFTFGDGTLGMDPRNFKSSSATSLFYFVNIAHDFYYSLGFTEAAGNFQTDNFNQGGVGGDAVLAEAQNGRVTNNSQFGPTPEGVAPRMRIGLFTRSTSSLTDDLDADYDGQVVIHEYGHGVSTRLVGGLTSTTCLNQIQSGAMGEGWSDYFAISYFNNPVLGGYSTQNFISGFRRQSYEGYTFTYEDVGNSGYETHNDGEIWAATLWDLRKSLGQAVSDRLVVDGLKGTPCHPSMTDARDAILSADLASGGANRPAIWTVFAKHGMGYSARGIDGTPKTGTLYDAAYDLPPDLQGSKNPAITSQPLTVTASVGVPYNYTVAASNPNGGTLTFALNNGPAGMTLDSSGAITWTTSFTDQRIKITVTDGKGGKVVHGYALPVVTPLTNGRPVLISGASNSAGYAFIDVPSGVPVLQVTLRGGTGNALLVAIDPTGLAELSFRSGTSQSLTFPNPKVGRWSVEVDALGAYSGTSLAASLITPPQLPAVSSVGGLSGVVGSETLYRVTVPAGGTFFQVSTSGGTGDVDLYLKFGSPAECQSTVLVTTFCSYDKSSAKIGNSESIIVLTPTAGDYYLDVSGFSDFSGVSLTTLFSTNPPGPDLTVSQAHLGAFAPIGNYTIRVTNAGQTATVGTVSVTDSLPASLTAASILGTGWTCLVDTLTCTRSDSLAPGSSYPSITMIVTNVANTAASVTNIVTVSGGGDLNPANNTVRDIAVLIAPAITGVVDSLGESTVITPNTWIVIQGSNLSPGDDLRVWDASDFVNNQMPTQLDGVSVTVNGKSAYVSYISPTQIDILTPPDAISGSINIQVTNTGVASNLLTVQAQAQSLSFCEFVAPGGLHYVCGRRVSDNTFIGPSSLFPGITRPVKPGDSIYLIASGFGATEVPVVSGSVTQSGNLPAPLPVVKIGGETAKVTNAGLGGVGWYRIDLTVPSDAPDGDLSLSATYNGLSTQANLLITVQH